MKSSDLMTVVIVIALVAGGWYLVTNHRAANAEAGYYEPRPDYFDNDPATLPSDWSGWNAKVDVLIHHATNRPGCDAIEYGWLAWREHVPAVIRNADTGAKRIVVRTDRLETPNDFVRVPAVELPYDRGVNVEASTRLQRNQFLVNWAHRYGFRFDPSTPNMWRDYYVKLKENPGAVIIVPSPGHSMKECRSQQEQSDCETSPSSMRCEDNRYDQSTPFLYPEWAADSSVPGVISYLKTKKHRAPVKMEETE